MQPAGLEAAAGIRDNVQLLPSARSRNQVGNLEFKAQTWASQFHAKFWGGSRLGTRRGCPLA